MKQLESAIIWQHTQLSRNTLYHLKELLLVTFFVFFWHLKFSKEGQELRSQREEGSIMGRRNY